MLRFGSVVVGNVANKVEWLHFLKQNIPRSVPTSLVGNVKQILAVSGKMGGSFFVRLQGNATFYVKHQILDVVCRIVVKQKVSFINNIYQPIKKRQNILMISYLYHQTFFATLAW